MTEQYELIPSLSASSTSEVLNPQQRAAVEHGEGPLLVVAGAGTGKTRVIIERIRYLLESDPALPGEAILGLTFTDKAAAEMRQRVTRAAGDRGRAVFLGTFHAFCNHLLLDRKPELQTLDEIDHWILLRRNLPRLELEHYRHLAEPGQFLGDFVKFFSRCQDELVTPEEYERYVAGLAEEFERGRNALPEDERLLREEELARQREVARAYQTSDRLLRENRRLTFGMQILDAVRALDTDAALLARLREQFRYVLVDEFQDTNIAQLRLLWRLAADHRNIVAVGDNAQAIYRFRGASFGSFTIFLRDFAGVSDGDLEGAKPFVRPLVDNYRSTARVLRVAGLVTRHIEHSSLVPKKELVPHRPEGTKVRIAEFATAAEEARWIAAEIARLRAAGAAWRSFAVLYRIHRHREHLVAALEQRGIPFVIRNLSILDRPIVRDVLAYLRLLVTPSDDVACARVLAVPASGFEAADLVRLCERAAKRRTSLWEMLQAPQSELGFHRQGQRAEELVAGMSELRQLAERADATEVYDALAEWLELAVVAAPEDRRYLDRLRQFVREWQQKAESTRFREFAQYLDYFVQANGHVNLEEEGGDTVQLMTVHAAKGLEFDHVFLLRLTHGTFPMRSQKKVLEFPVGLMKEEVPRGDHEVMEERRLFYVALTRAKDRLTLTTVVNKRSKPSPFLDDILGAPQVARDAVEQTAPEAPPSPRTATAGDGSLFAEARRSARVYSRIGEWAASYRPPLFEPLEMSASAVNCYLKCPLQYLFSREWRLRGGPGAATTFGNVMHTTIKQLITALHRGGRPSFEEVATIFEREWTGAGFEDAYQEECYRRDGIEQLRTFYAQCLEAPPNVFAQEKRFALELDGGVRVTGRMDQINRVAEGLMEIVDYKTGKPKTEPEAKKDLQLGVYAMAAREEMELGPVRLVFYNLQTNETVASERDEKQLAKVRATILDAAANIRAREFPARPGYHCRNCEYNFVCPTQEPLRVIPAEPDGGASHDGGSAGDQATAAGARTRGGKEKRGTRKRPA